jgi:prepilin-type processing-associated H-X9-DG protein
MKGFSYAYNDYFGNGWADSKLTAGFGSKLTRVNPRSAYIGDMMDSEKDNLSIYNGSTYVSAGAIDYELQAIRHGNAGNFSYLDGSAKGMRWKEYSTDLVTAQDTRWKNMGPKTHRDFTPEKD